MKPLIGVMPLIDYEKESLWMLPGYMEGLIEAGAAPVMFPLTDDDAVLGTLCGRMDGFLFTGGQDVSPSLYGEKVRFSNVSPSPERDREEKKVLSYALEHDVPVLGICRGIQFLNAFLGGTLYQDIPNEHQGANHCQKPPYDAPCHMVKILPGTPMQKLLKKNSMGVNSYHHQAIKKLSERLVPEAVSSDGLPEAVYMPDKSYVNACQWHPEFSYKANEDSKKIFCEFVRHSIDLMRKKEI